MWPVTVIFNILVTGVQTEPWEDPDHTTASPGQPCHPPQLAFNLLLKNYVPAVSKRLRVERPERTRKGQRVLSGFWYHAQQRPGIAQAEGNSEGCLELGLT